MTKAIPWVKYEKISEERGKFIVSPLHRGVGVTLGNSLRRILLSSLSGCGVTSLKIDSVKHEFSTIDNVVDDVFDVICNLKSLVFRGDFEGKKTGIIDVKKAGVIKAKDIKFDSEVDIVNKNCYIAEVSSGGNLRMEVTVESGIGYRQAELNDAENQVIDVINVDTTFSPVRKVNHEVERIRVGKALDYDRLVLDVSTDGSVTPEDAVKEAAEILIDKYNLFKTINEEPKGEEVETKDESSEKMVKSALNMTIDDLELTARSSNCLKRAGIESVAKLVDKSVADLTQIKNFGKKSADEINDKLKQYGLSLKEA